MNPEILTNELNEDSAILIKKVESMEEELLRRTYINADETTLKVINDNGKDSKSKKYMWLYMSNTNSKPVILYDYQSTRSS